MINIKKVSRVSISRSGLRTDTFPNDTETIALLIPSNGIEAEKYKKAYVGRFKGTGHYLEHVKDIHYKKPFWKFWGMNDYSIAVFKLKINV